MSSLNPIGDLAVFTHIYLTFNISVLSSSLFDFKQVKIQVRSNQLLPFGTSMRFGLPLFRNAGKVRGVVPIPES